MQTNGKIYCLYLYICPTFKVKAMLIDFKFKNFLSYKDDTRLLLTTIKSFKEHWETNVIETKKGLNLLKSTAIYGSNGGGKTNLISAFGFMCNVVYNSFSESLKKQEDRGRRDFFYKLNVDTENAPSTFEVTFIVQDIIYRYGFSIKGFEIISEWLYKKVEVETNLFERNGSNFKINKTGFPEGEKYKTEVNSNVLFISHLAQYNATESRNVYNWFNKVSVISGLENEHYSVITKTLLNKSQEFRSWLNLAVKFLEITNVETGENNQSIIAYHKRYDSNNVIVDAVGFDITKDESDGTCKLIYLLGIIYDTLVNSRVLFIDELDSKLHPNLLLKLMEFFHKLNRNGSQFVFTAHDAILLDKDILRRDQIWFVDRNKFGVSELYGMSEFDANVVRNTSDFRKKYLGSVFGAAESIEITDELINLMYE